DRRFALHRAGAGHPPDGLLDGELPPLADFPLELGIRLGTPRVLFVAHGPHASRGCRCSRGSVAAAALHNAASIADGIPSNGLVHARLQELLGSLNAAQADMRVRRLPNRPIPGAGSAGCAVARRLLDRSDSPGASRAEG